MELATKFNIIRIAEGIETAEQLGRLCGLACQLGQGFLFSLLLEPAAAGAFLRASLQGR